ncbi:hypothetical protein ACA910_010126 [Epithemia clementina (nom. ined.)]
MQPMQRRQRLQPQQQQPQDLEFLGSLLSFLQEEWQLPERLPMVYQRIVPDDDSNEHNNDAPAVLILESPLSPSPLATTLKLELVVIYPQPQLLQGKDTAATSSTSTASSIMAMVAVKKDAASKQAFANLPPMLRNLFAESERQIMKALDRSLQDFETGVVVAPTSGRRQRLPQPTTKPKNEVDRQRAAAVPADWIGELWDDDDDYYNEYEMKQAEEVPEKPDPTGKMAATTKTRTKTTSSASTGTNRNDNSHGAVVDAEVIHSTTTTSKNKNVASSKDIATKRSATARTTTSQPEQHIDFAVRAAQQAAQKRQNDEGFSVTAARRAAAKQQKERRQLQEQQQQQLQVEQQTSPPPPQKSAQSPPSDATREKEDFALNKIQEPHFTAAKQQQPPSQTQQQQDNNNNDDDNYDEQVDLSTLRPASLRPENVGPRAFHQTISIPQKYQNQKLKKKKSTRNTATADEAVSQPSKKPSQQVQVSQPPPEEKVKSFTTSTTTRVPSKTKPNDVGTAPNKVSVALTDCLDEGTAVSPDKEENEARGETWRRDVATTDSVQSRNKDLEKEEDEAVRSVNDALDEMVNNSQDLTPEQLLESVMQFGDAKEKEERAGDGFVSGAFEKAKALLKEQHKQRQHHVAQTREEKYTAAVSTKDATTVELNSSSGSIRSLTPEEELKQMFEAGERLANGRISNSLSKAGKDGSTLSGPKSPGTTEEDVDTLIANDKDVSDYARLLDEELVELEIKLNKSPEDQSASFDGGRPNYDLFSGPEVYNPNVDPETAVNWPGSRPGTKDLKKRLQRMPKDLREAVAQAEFAATALYRLKEAKVSNQENSTSSTQYFIGDKQVTAQQVQNLRNVLSDAVEIGLIRDPLVLLAERSRLQLLVDELWNQPDDRLKEIAMNYKDVLLSENFVQLMQERLSVMVERDLEALRRDESDDDDKAMDNHNAREREILGRLVVQAQLLVKEARALGAELEAQQLEVIRSICKVAMDPMYTTEEETAMALTDAVRDMRPLLDDAFVAYLKYAVAEEEGRLARAGVLDDIEHNQWLWVLKIVQNGVYTELARGIQRYMDHIGYVLRMETPVERRMLLEKLIDVMPTLDVRPFVAVVDNLAGALGDGARGEFGGDTTTGESEAFALGRMTNQILQLYRDVHELLPPERIALKAKDADEWAARQKKKLLEQRKVTQQRLQAARQTEEFDEAVDALGRQGELERFDS